MRIPDLPKNPMNVMEQRERIETKPAVNGRTAEGFVALTLEPSGTSTDERARDMDEDEQTVLAPETVRHLLSASEARLGIIRAILADTQRTMEQFRARREELALALREALAHGASLRRVNFDQMLSPILQHHERREEEVRRTLEEFRQEEEAMSVHLRRLLTKEGGVRLTDFKRVIGEFRRKEEARLRATTTDVESKLRQMKVEVEAMLGQMQQAAVGPALQGSAAPEGKTEERRPAE